MAKVNKSTASGLKVVFGSKKKGKHTKHVNKHNKTEKPYVGQGR
jgi:hypothetical protein